MRHIHHKISADFFGDLADALKINGAGISGSAGNDQFWFMLQSQSADGIVIEHAGFLIQPIGYEVKVLSRHVDRGTMSQVAAVRQAHPHDRVAGLEQGKINGSVCLCTGMRLHICMFCAK